MLEFKDWENMDKGSEINLNYRRLMEVQRCNNFQTVRNEDVVQHSYYVALYATIIATEYNKTAIGSKYDLEKVMRNAIFHDVEETFFSDIPRNIKHHTPEVNSIIEGAVSEKLDEIYCNSTANEFLKVNRTAKDGFEGELVDMVDMLELALYCCEEYCLGNKLIEQLLDKAVRIIEQKSNFDRLLNGSSTFKDLYTMLSSDRETMCNMYRNSMNID